MPDAAVDGALDVGRQADQAGVGRLLLTHLLPGTDPSAARAAAGRTYAGPIEVASAGTIVDLG